MGKVLLFYKYVSVEYPKRLMKWQRQICTDLKLTGRIFVGTEGINGTVGGSDEATDRYKEIMHAHPDFADVDFKESEGGADAFNGLAVRVRNEIVHFGQSQATSSQANTGIHLTPAQVHALIEKKPNDLVILDARNDYEWAVGAFEGAIKPPIQNFRDLPDYIDRHLDLFQNKQVLMYCTGGIRCERATTYLKQKGVATQVYQILGGIHRYAEQFPDGYFRGKNYVFDNRIALRVNKDVLGSCSLCSKPCDDYTNCINATCNNHYISCAHCSESYVNTCGTSCKELVLQRAVKVRPSFAQEFEKIMASRGK